MPGQGQGQGHSWEAASPHADGSPLLGHREGCCNFRKEASSLLEEPNWPTGVLKTKSYGDHTFQGLPNWLCMNPKSIRHHIL